MEGVSAESVPVPPPLPVAVELPARPRVWTVFVALGLVLAASLTAGTVAAGIVAVRNPDALRGGSAAMYEGFAELASTYSGMILFFGPPAVMGAVAAVAGAICSPMPFRQRLLLRPFARPVPIALAAVLGVLAYSQLAGMALMPLQSEQLLLFSKVFASLDAPKLVLAVILVGLVAGTAEELLFRGYIQSRLMKAWSPRVGLLVTSLIFGAYHMDPVHSLFAFVLGLCLGYITLRTGSIVPAILAHVTNNCVSVVATNLAGEIDVPLAAPLIGSVAVLVVSAGVIVRYAKAEEVLPPMTPMITDQTRGC